MSDTRLIYVSKGDALVKNDKDGAFMNAVDEGVVVNVGDEISIEGIAVNSTGVGGEIIEVPEKLKGYEYKTNSQILNCMVYLHHNHQWGCMLPFITETNHTAVNPTVHGDFDDKYGYLTLTGMSDGNLTGKSSDTMQYTKTINQTDQFLSGGRYYLGSFNKDPLNPNPEDSDEPKCYPSQRVFNFIETKLGFEVDVGYDNPNNIASKITSDFHSADPSPAPSVNQKFSTRIVTGGVLQENNYPAKAYINEDVTHDSTGTTGQSNYPYALRGYVNTSKDSSVITINAQPVHLKPPANKFYSMYQDTIAVRNPFYWYWGSRLLSTGVFNINIEGTVKANGYSVELENLGTITSAFSDGDICTYNVLPNNGTDTVFNDGAILILNLPADDADCLYKLQQFIHSQKEFPTAETPYTPQEMKSTKKNLFRTEILLGRCKPIAQNNQLALENRYNGDQTDIDPTKNYYNQTFYDREFINKAYLDTASINAGFKIENNINVAYKGVSYKFSDLARKLDLNIVNVKAPLAFGQSQNCIGIVMKEANITNQVFPIASYALVDFGFSRLKANALLVMNPILSGIAPSVAPTLEIDKFCQSLNVGSPNIDMIFDGTRGRFALENMSWVNYIDSGYGSSPISTAGNSVITKNKASNFKNAQGQVENLPFLFFRPVPYQWLQYAQTGLGIRNVSVLTLDDEPVEIDPLDDNDIRNKYSKSLLDRLGFSYEQLTDSYGLPDAIFTQRHYQTTRKLPYTNFFPYPLTNNLEFDTAKNEGLSVNASGLPMFNPNVTRGTNINISAESDKTYAVSLPRKLVFPYWLIQSDIITGVNYSSNGKPQNILAICSRTYTNGDFALSPQSNYSFIATMPFVITGIKTTILNPDYTSANVEDGTCVIYKVVSPIPMFKPEEEEPKTQKKIKS